MANYLVTGGAGFIGANIVRALVARGEHIRVVDNFSTGRRENLADVSGDVEILEGDLRDPDVCRAAAADMTYVLHQAALPSVPRSVANPLECHEANVSATVNLLIAARDAGVRRVVYAGSSSAYGNQAAAQKSEDLAPQPLSPYAAAKVSCEHYLRAFSECYDLETVTLRYFNVFGPYQDPNSPYSAVIPIFVRALLQGKSPVIHGDGSQARDFTFVENNVRANLAAATVDFPVRGQVYNIACGVSITVRQLFDAIREHLGGTVEPTFAPSRQGDVYSSTADISRAQRDLGYSVSVPFEAGLAQTIDWYRAHLVGGSGA